jgi:hypothetical protein
VQNDRSVLIEFRFDASLNRSPAYAKCLAPYVVSPK